jgi:Tfp pilus assembly protein PilE
MKNQELFETAKEHTRRPFAKQRGDAMLSVTVALIILAIIAGGIFMAFRENTRKNEVKEAVSLVSSIGSEMRQKYGSTNMYRDVTTAIAVQSRAIPESYRVAGTNTAQNVWGGAITIAPVDLTSANDAVALTMNAVPQNECMDIVTGTQAVGRRVRVAGVAVKPTDAELSLANLATQCESGPNVAIEWAVGRTGS